ncbi:MAG: Rho termination factor N-terminal domain-containing protein [Desulfobaccales bacterium]
MTLSQIRGKARGLGVKSCSRLRKTELIRAIQLKEGNLPCYRAISACQQHDCLWQPDCAIRTRES